jgi:hypothetical protein
MSKKSKLILATAVFGAALFGASCGGGGGTAAGGGGGSGGGGGGNQPPPATEEGKVLALLDVGSAGAGTVKPMTICKLMSNNKVECGNDLNPNADLNLEYVYEFGNENVALKAGDVLYFFNGSQVIKPTSYRALGATSDTSAPGGINIPSGTVTYYATDDFVIIHSTGGGNTVIAVSKTGKVIKDTGISSSNIDESCETVTKSGTTYKLNTDGTSSNITATIPDEVLYSAGDKSLVRKGTRVYLSDSGCSATGVLVDTLSSGVSINDVYMVKVIDSNNNPHFFIAIRTSTNSNRDVKYYRVSGDSATDLTSSGAISLYATGLNPYYYALDGRGRLYAITAADTVRVYNTEGTLAGTASVTGVAGFLGLADRALAKTGTNVYQITTTGSAATAVDKGTALYTVVNNCTHTDTRSVDGAGTNFVRCAHNSGLYSLTFDSGTGLYSQASHSVTISSDDDVKWATNKVLVKPSTGSIQLCSTTTTPSISCSDTDLLDLNPTNINSGKYLKFNGNNVFYLSGTSPKVGDIFGTQTTLPIAVSSPSGGNASFDLTKFAFSFKPAGAACNTRIAYFSSPTANPKLYALPSGACVERILKAQRRSC